MSKYQDPEIAHIAFDQYQRYRLVAEVLDRLWPNAESRDLLEVGGHPGLLRKFRPQDRIIVADMVTGIDSLDMYSAAEHLPFADNSFSSVIAVDVLEHIRPENREAVINEISRVSSDVVLLAAPFDYALARASEKLVFDFIKDWLGYEHKFLKDHLENPSPSLGETESQLVKLGYDTIIIPNGQIERWLVMMLGYYYFDGFPNALDLRKEISLFYNTNFFDLDVAEPAYRHLIVGSRKTLRENRNVLDDILAKKVQTPEPSYERLKLWLQLFITGETRRLLDQIKVMRTELEEKNEEIKNRKEYITQLEDFHRKVRGSLAYKIYEGLFKRN